MRLYKTRYKYWSSSKFANWVNDKFNVPKRPKFATLEEWERIKTEHKQYRFAYWFTEKFLRNLQNVVYFPYDVYYTIKVLVMNRFIQKNYMLESDLDKWQYRDYDDRLLHSVFDSYCNDFCIREKGRGSELKLYEYWEWEQELKKEHWQDDELIELDEPSFQAIHAKKQQELYEWWQARKIQIEKDDFIDYETEEYFHNQDDEKLKELIDIRRGLWT